VTCYITLVKPCRTPSTSILEDDFQLFTLIDLCRWYRNSTTLRSTTEEEKYHTYGRLFDFVMAGESLAGNDCSPAS